MLRVIDEVRPTWVVGENVAGITTMVEGGVLTPMGSDTTLFGEGDGLHRYELRQSFTIERICRDLEGLGYSVQPVLVPAAAVGAPHRRDRVFIIAYAGGGNIVAGDNSEREIQVPFSHSESVPFYGSISGRRRNKEREKFSKSGGGDSEDASHSHGQGREESQLTELLPENRWRDFPTVSPVHRGNDGIPFPMDCLTVPPIPKPPTYGKGSPKQYPFGKWRTESLKAYGNAIVPQVMYRIFQAIESVEE